MASFHKSNVVRVESELTSEEVASVPFMLKRAQDGAVCVEIFASQEAEVLVYVSMDGMNWIPVQGGSISVKAGVHACAVPSVPGYEHMLLSAKGKGLCSLAIRYLQNGAI